jgi:exosortase
MSQPAPARPRPGILAAVVAVPAVALLWSYWTTLAETGLAWGSNPQYSHGYLVPIFAAFLLWLRRDRLRLDGWSPSWWGAPLILLAVVMRLVGSYYGFDYADAISLLPCLMGLVLMVGGWPVARWSWPAVAFLFFMIPIPYSVAGSLSGPLQSLATACSTFALQTLGLPALAEGNVIRINDSQIGIVEACSGLRMLVVFFALSTGMVLVIQAPLVDKLLLVASSVPIALVSNVLRITVTGYLYETVGGQAAEVFFHDVAGWLMMPMALGLLWLEWKVLEKLFVQTPAAPGRAPVRGRGRPSAPRRQQRSAPQAAGARRSAEPPPSEPLAPAAEQQPDPVPAQEATA